MLIMLLGDSDKSNSFSFKFLSTVKSLLKTFIRSQSYVLKTFYSIKFTGKEFPVWMLIMLILFCYQLLSPVNVK